MSYSSVVVPAENEQSDSRILIEACLAHVRKDAGLDADPVLPPLDVLLGKAVTPPAKRLVVGPSAREMPSPESIVKSSVRPGKTTAKIERSDKPEKSLGRRMRWPVFLCGFIGGIFGGVALMTSPVGQKPAVQQVVKQVQGHLEIAYDATAAATARLVKR